MSPVTRQCFFMGARSGMVLGVLALAFAVLGLTPSLSWIPEVPLISAAVILPLGVLAWTGFHAQSRSDRPVAGAGTGGLAGAIGGSIGGLAFVFFGKPALNIVVGLVAGTIVGAAVGLVGSVIGVRRRERASSGPASRR